MKRLLLLLVTVSFIAGPEPVSIVRLDPAVEKAEARPGGRGGGFRGGGGRAAMGARPGGGRSFGRASAGRGAFASARPPTAGTRPGGDYRVGGRPSGVAGPGDYYAGSRPSTRPSRPAADPGRRQGNRPSTLPARPAGGALGGGAGAGTRPGTRPGVRPPIAGAPRPSHPIALPPGSRPPGYRPPGWRPPEWRPPSYPPPYPRPPHWYWGDYNYWPEWGWFFTGAVAGATLVYVAELDDEDCEEVTYEGERLYLCDGVLYRATIYKDEAVYEIVTEPDEVIAAGGGSAGTYQDDRPLMLTSPRMQGERVLKLQQALADRGLDIGGIDGVFGPATDRALRTFQRQSGLVENGVVDEPTRAALTL